MRAGIQLYVEEGVPPGSFLYAVLCNDLVGAINQVDSINKDNLAEWIKFCYWELPSECWGSPEKVSKWMEGRRKVNADNPK